MWIDPDAAWIDPGAWIDPNGHGSIHPHRDGSRDPCGSFRMCVDRSMLIWIDPDAQGSISVAWIGPRSLMDQNLLDWIQVCMDRPMQMDRSSERVDDPSSSRLVHYLDRSTGGIDPAVGIDPYERGSIHRGFWAMSIAFGPYAYGSIQRRGSIRIGDRSRGIGSDPCNMMLGGKISDWGPEIC